MTKGKFHYMFDPPGMHPSQLPKWEKYLAVLKRDVVNDPESDQVKDELADALETIAFLEAWRDRDLAQQVEQVAQV
ncbi:hypothetical protein AGMMS49545_20490 [Betaproteobacteria bacterium]|nr:hypothetical protein AGMMS49545_20490 [Betaproteobacteria bacterium]GHU46387.1 hypothetical protein AGMMS50289_19720 [Betaproteobacteria bacterium]